jgi:hypothetical protein
MFESSLSFDINRILPMLKHSLSSKCQELVENLSFFHGDSILA